MSNLNAVPPFVRHHMLCYAERRSILRQEGMPELPLMIVRGILRFPYSGAAEIMKGMQPAANSNGWGRHP